MRYNKRNKSEAKLERLETYSFGTWLQQRRNQLRLTQKEVGAAALCSSAMIRKIEADERKPSLELAHLLASALQIPSEQQGLFVEVARQKRPFFALQELLSHETGAEERGWRAETTAIQNNLPNQPTPFIGRDEELASLMALLGEENGRLITIVGGGGMGKTRLALAFAERLIASQAPDPFPFPDGIFFINLAPLSDVAHIIPTLAESLHFPLQDVEQAQRPPAQQILDYLREKQMLFIMDNFEHLLAGAAFVNDILQTASGVRMIVTSRERLHLRQEQLYPIQGLEFPDLEVAATDHEDREAASYSAVRLFLQSAQRNQPNFQLSDGLTHLAQICRLVMGMPLAIELAAAWVDTLSLPEIVREIQESLDFLETEMRDAPERHRSIRAAIDTSWQKLSTDEKTAFAQLSIFRGGFTRQAGQTITSATLRRLSRLVAKSFLQYDPERRRYQIHELMRQYGQEKLIADRELETAVRQQHSRYYCHALAQRAADLQGQRQRQAIAEIELDIENARAAWERAVHDRDAGLLELALFSLFRFYEWNGRYQDWEQSTNKAIAQLNQPQPTPDQQAILIKLLHLKFARTTSIEKKQTLLDQTDVLLAQLIEAEIDVSALQAEDALCQGQLHIEEGNFPEAEPSLQKSIAYYQQSGEQWQEANVWRTLSVGAARQGLFDHAEACGQRALSLARKLGDQRQMALTLHGLGFNAFNRGHLETMRQCMEEALEIAQDVGQIPLQGLMLMEIGTSYFTEGRLEEAIRYHQNGLKILQKVGDWPRVAWSMSTLAGDYLFQGDTTTADQWLQEGDKLARELQHVRVLAYHLNMLGWSALVQQKYDEAFVHVAEAVKLIEYGVAFGLVGYIRWSQAWVQLVYEQWPESEKNLYEAMQIKQLFIYEVFQPIAYLMARRLPTAESVKRAWQLIGLWEVSSHFVNWPLFNAFTERFQPPALFEISQEEIEAAKANGRSLDPAAVLTNLIEELPKLGWSHK